MHVGATMIFQALGDGRSDRDVYLNDLQLADLAEPLGFDSLWDIEHHFTDYTMCPDALQMLTYYAGRTQRIQLGTMVVVLPWHQSPMRVAEQISVLDHVSNGRLILGIGRGLGRVEFQGFGVNQEEARERFIESAEMVISGLEQGYCEYDGQFIKQTRRDIRPRPFKSFRGRTYAAAVSPESSQIMAKLGIGLLIVPQKPWQIIVSELETYRKAFREYHGEEAPPPFVAGWTYCDENPQRAEEMARKYIGDYWNSAVRHYELDGTHLMNMKGYEAYRVVQERTGAPGGAQQNADFYLSLQVWGTPERCYQRIKDIQEMTGAQGYMGIFSFGGMPYDMAERSMRLFAKEIMPEAKKIVPREKQFLVQIANGERAAQHA